MKKFHPDFVTAIEMRHEPKRVFRGDSNRSREEYLEDQERRHKSTKHSVQRNHRLKKIGF